MSKANGDAAPGQGGTLVPSISCVGQNHLGLPQPNGPTAADLGGPADPPTQTTLSTARGYVAAGISVIPIAPDGSKAPAVDRLPGRTWNQYRNRLPTDDELVDWFHDGTCGIALIGGAVSGNLEIPDFDAPGAFEEFRVYCEDNGAGDLLARLVLVKTPGEGRFHLYLRCEEGVSGSHRLAALAEPYTDADGKEHSTKIETKGEGGYVVAPGSPGACHPTGREYTVIHGSISNIPTLTAEEHLLLTRMAQMCDEQPVADARSEERTRADYDGPMRPGDDYNARGDALALLQEAGWVIDHAKGECVHLTRPGKSKGTSATWNYIGCRRLIVFTTSSSDFDGPGPKGPHGYDAFGVYARLKHGGNLAAAAKALREEGYGANDDGYPTLDPTALYGLAGDFVRALEPHVEVCEANLLFSFLTAFGNLAGRNPHQMIQGARHGTNLFAVVVGRSAKSRKSTGLALVMNFICDCDPVWNATCVTTGLSTGEGLIKAVQDDVWERRRKDPKSQDSEMEDVLIEPGVLDKRLFVKQDEFSSVLVNKAREGNNLSETLCEAWDNNNLATKTRNRPLRATAPHVSILAATTEGTLNARLDRIDAASGFANRFLWVFVYRSKYISSGRVDVDPSTMATLRARTREAADFAMRCGELQLSPDAAELWDLVYRQFPDPPGALGDMMGRAEAQTRRLAGLYAILDCTSTIRPDHITAALGAWEYVQASIERIFGPRQSCSPAERLLQALKRNPAGMTKTDLFGVFANNVAAKDLDAMLVNLAAGGKAYKVTTETTGARGRQTERWYANTEPVGSNLRNSSSSEGNS